jgi:PAS domain-containing protein
MGSQEHRQSGESRSGQPDETEAVSWEDVSEKAVSNEAEDRSNEAQALVRSILNGLQEPTIVVDTDGRITHINTQALDLYETTEAEAVGVVPNALQGAGSDASDIVTEAIDRGEDIQQREETIVAGRGETPVERTATATPITSVYVRDPDGNLVEIGSEH